MYNNKSYFINDQHNVTIKLKEFYENNPYGNRKFYGVTRVLSDTKSDEDKAALQKWKDSIGEEKAEEIFQESMKIGSSLDNIIEKYLQSEFNYSNYKAELGIKLFYQIKPYLDKLTPIATQVHLYSDEYKVQGYCDAICIMNNELTMVDFKNSRKKKTEQYVEDYFLQCTIYILLLYKMTGILIKNIAIMVAVRSDERSQLFTAKVSDYVLKAKERIKQFQELKLKKEN